MSKDLIHFLKIILIISTTMAFWSCAGDDECRKEKSVMVSFAFKKKILNEKTGTYAISNLIIDSIWVKATERDSLLYNKKRNVSTLDLPLKKFSQPTEFIIRFNTITDTLLIFHDTNENYFLSLECGCIAVHSINEVITTGHYIDSISILNKDVNTTKTTHIQIFN